MQSIYSVYIKVIKCSEYHSYLYLTFSSVSSDGSWVTRLTNSSIISGRIRLQGEIKEIIIITMYGKIECKSAVRCSIWCQDNELNWKTKTLFFSHWSCDKKYKYILNWTEPIILFYFVDRTTGKMLSTYKSMSFLFWALHSCRTSSSSKISCRVTSWLKKEKRKHHKLAGNHYE